MSAPARRLNQRSLEADVNREVARVTQEHTVVRHGGGQPCRVCSDPEARRRVNLLLSHGVGISEILLSISDINAKRKKNKQIKYWSVQNHRANHFNIQEPANEAYRRILERRREEEADTLGEGITNILTARGYLEIIASKGFETLVKTDTAVGFTTGLDAQLKLEELMKADQDQAVMSAMRRDVAMIQQAIQDTLSDDQMRAISKRLDELRGVAPEDNFIEGQIIDDADDDDDDEADFDDDGDDD
jgi:hypothetical protein